MKLSYILATCDRYEIIGETLESLNGIEGINRDNFELLIIDQSFNNKTYDILQSFDFKFEVLYFHSIKKGLSYSRNTGINFSTGDYITFVDDDALYDKKIYETFVGLSKSNLDMYSGSVRVPHSLDFTQYSQLHEKSKIDMYNFISAITSISIFIKRSFINEKNLRFDEEFGLGAKFSSCEELDLVYHMLMEGATGLYEPELIVYHENPGRYSPEKTYLYSLGHGAFCKKLLLTRVEGEYFPILYTIKKIAKLVLRFPLSIIKSGYHPISYSKGFLKGYTGYKGKL
ncbi:glycosyltransferase family 2 protein [Pseudoalteromonas sp. T1lg23B]|uniref:glycosyltransferase family 2 protein n=1 Tax=Pseudoalteromonas sp. T1lg23B TaxID=2077097 RepID=UPI000CF6ACC0|nr:glycosyltransferase family 2 protein [Pseudoalteromonas sp. T1lg23B]